MGNAVICGNAVSPVNTTSPSEPTPSQTEEQLRYVKSVLALPRLQRRRRESVMSPVYDANGQVINADDGMWVYWRPDPQGGQVVYYCPPSYHEERARGRRL